MRYMIGIAPCLPRSSSVSGYSVLWGRSTRLSWRVALAPSLTGGNNNGGLVRALVPL